MKVEASHPLCTDSVANDITANQPIFGLVISTIEHLARDVNDFPTAKLSLNVLARMVATWGGPDVVPHPAIPRGGVHADGEGKAKLEGFDQFMMTSFSPLCWAIPGNASFDSKDAQGKQVLGEAAALQKAIYSKTGKEYLDYLRSVELSGMGMNAGTVEEYLSALSTMELKAFQQYFKVRRILDAYFCNTDADSGLESCTKECEVTLANFLTFNLASVA